MRLSLGEVVCDASLQMRLEINGDAVEDYAAPLREDQSFDLPPVVVFFDGERHWLADGFHRIGAYRLAYRVDIPVDVRKGGKRDALLFALSANARNGLRRTNADKRRAVEIALQDEEWAKWSDSKVAELCAVNQSTVSRIRGSLMQSISEPPPERTYTTKHGTTATMRTENIGKRRARPVSDATPSKPTPTPETKERLPRAVQPIDAEKRKQILFLRKKRRGVEDIAKLLGADEATVDEICTAAEASGELVVKSMYAYSEKIVEELDAKKREYDLANGIAPQPQREPSPLEEMRTEALPLIEAIQAELKKPDMERERVRQSAYGIKKALGGWNDRDALLHLKSFWDLASNEEQEAFRRWIETR